MDVTLGHLVVLCIEASGKQTVDWLIWRIIQVDACKTVLLCLYCGLLFAAFQLQILFFLQFSDSC